MLTITIICYAIVMGVGWVLAIRERPGEPMSTIPVLSLASYLFFAFTFFEACEDDSCIKFWYIYHSVVCWTCTNDWCSTVHCSWCYSERTKRSCLWSVCWRVWYDWWMLLYSFSMLLFRLQVRRSRSNIRFLILYALFFKFCTLFSFIYCTHISITVYLYMCGGPDATYKYISFISFTVFILAYCSF